MPRKGEKEIEGKGMIFEEIWDKRSKGVQGRGVAQGRGSGA